MGRRRRETLIGSTWDGSSMKMEVVVRKGGAIVSVEIFKWVVSMILWRMDLYLIIFAIDGKIMQWIIYRCSAID